MQNLEGQFGNPGVTRSLKEIAKCPEPYQSPLNKIYKELNELVAKLDKVNQENAGLIQQALKYVNFAMDTFAKDEREVTYSPGEQTPKMKVEFLIKKPKRRSSNYEYFFGLNIGFGDECPAKSPRSNRTILLMPIPKALPAKRL